MLQIPNTDSNSHYLRTCNELHRESHPARFPADLPRFFVKFLTDPGDLVVDIFSGSNTTGQVAEELDRRWLSIELDRHYAALSAIRFIEDLGAEAIRPIIEELEGGTFKSFGGVRTSVTDENVTPIVIQPKQTGLTFE